MRLEDYRVEWRKPADLDSWEAVLGAELLREAAKDLGGLAWEWEQVTDGGIYGWEGSHWAADHSLHISMFVKAHEHAKMPPDRVRWRITVCEEGNGPPISSGGHKLSKVLVFTGTLFGVAAGLALWWITRSASLAMVLTAVISVTSLIGSALVVKPPPPRGSEREGEIARELLAALRADRRVKLKRIRGDSRKT